jgi:hypothetical protein
MQWWPGVIASELLRIEQACCDSCCLPPAPSGRLPEGLEEDLRQGVASIEALMGKRFGDPTAPLLLSVRSGAAVRGMCDVLSNGMCDALCCTAE